MKIQTIKQNNSKMQISRRKIYMEQCIKNNVIKTHKVSHGYYKYAYDISQVLNGY